jgi:hypothetical protein
VDAWCARTGSKRGASMTLEQCWHLSQLWYPPRLQADWQRKNAQETEAVFAQVGLSGEFWRLNPR